MANSHSGAPPGKRRYGVANAEFLTSGATDQAFWPVEGPPEIAIAGRSNVGKSTLLAALLGRNGLVRTSSTPGRTRLINFYGLDLIDGNSERHPLRLVDLPGFGYAKVSRSERQGWRGFVESYLGHRKTLRACVLLIDARRTAEIDETEIIHWLQDRGVPVLIGMTKCDQLPKHARKPAAEKLAGELAAALGNPVNAEKRRLIMLTATTGEGIDELWARLVALLPPLGAE